MKNTIFLFFLLLALLLAINWTSLNNNWKVNKQKDYLIFYTKSDQENIKNYTQIINGGIKSAEQFFNSSFKNNFEIYIHPNRKSLDSTWQSDWKMPQFKSECWMVASGVGNKLDVISPKNWKQQSCEHNYSNKIKTQQLITHELIHVFHGQKNKSSDFSDMEGVDWLVEGIATYASGQCDSIRLSELKNYLKENKTALKLDDFWKGKHKYGLSGSMIMFIDKKYGRKKLTNLLPFNKKQEVLDYLKITEIELLEDWSAFVSGL